MDINTSKRLHTCAASIPTAVVAVAGLIWVGIQPAGAADAGQETVYDGCMETLYGASLNCTANDVSLARATNILITDPCDYPGDSTTFTATFETMLNAQARYDIGIFFDTGGDPEYDGAYTGTCSISSLHYKDEPAWLDLDGLTNPLVGEKKASGIQDTCGDIDANHNPLYPQITITAVCTDADLDGKLDLPYCTSWRQPGSNQLCTGPLPEAVYPGRYSSGVIPGAPSKCKCDAGFNVDVPVPPASLSVTKKANGAEVTSINEPEASVQFTVTVTNGGVDPNNAVTLTSLLDSIYGDITTTGHDGITATNCVTGGIIQPAQTYTCQFTAEVALNAGQSEQDWVTATGLDIRGNTVEGQDDATVTATDVLPTVSIVKNADPTSVFEPGGDVTFTVTITNGSVEPLTITSLVDDIYGTLAGDLDCQVGTVLASGANCSFQFKKKVGGNAGDSKTDTVTVVGTDDEGNEASASESATVTVNGLDSSIQLSKTAEPKEIDEPGGVILFTFTVTNTSAADSVTIDKLTDSVYGNLVGNYSSTCAVPQPLSVGQSYTCVAYIPVTGEPGPHQNLATASGIDDDGNPVSASDDETVTIKNVPPSATLTKTVTKLCATYQVTVTNTSMAEELNLISLIDDKYGDLDEYGTCAVPQTIAGGESYTCTFEGCTTISPTVDKVTGTVSDNDGGAVTPSDSAEVTFGKPATP